MVQIDAAIKGISPFNLLVASIANTIHSCVGKMRTYFSGLFSDDDVEELKKEIWGDLSSVYYKYEDNTQKKAFREVIIDIASNLNQGKWRSIYNKLHKIEYKNTRKAVRS